MNFQNKNFSYVTKPFGTFLDEVYAGGLQYLRTISTEQPSKVPANLAADFPELKGDFYLPTQLSFASNNAHSSPLRISGPVTMWLHYDVSDPSKPGPAGTSELADLWPQGHGECPLSNSR